MDHRLPGIISLRSRIARAEAQGCSARLRIEAGFPLTSRHSPRIWLILNLLLLGLLQGCGQGGDLVALPRTTELAPNGWKPTADATWRIFVMDPLTTPPTVVHSLNGTVSVSDPDAAGKVGEISQVWDGRNATEQLVQDGEYEVFVRALGALSIGNGLTRFGGPAQVTIGPEKFSIENEQVEPDGFDPEANETAKLSFDLVTRDLDPTGPEPDFEWQVRAVNDDATFKDFGLANSTAPGPYNATRSSDGTQLHVELTWDGHGDNNTTITGNYAWEIEAMACGETVLPRSGAALLRHIPDGCLRDEATVHSQAGGLRLELIQGGAVTVVKPSFLFEVAQFVDHLNPGPNPDPGTLLGEILNRGRVSEVELRVTLTRLPEGLNTPLNLTLEVRPDSTQFHAAGHVHAGHKLEGRWPVGIFREAETPPGPHTDTTLKQWTDLVTDAPMSPPSVKTSVRIEELGTPVSTYWWAPIVAGGVEFSVETASGVLLRTKPLAVHVDGLEPVEPALAAANLTYTTTNAPQDLDQTVNFVIVTGATVDHPVNHFGTPAFNQKLVALAKEYHRATGRSTWFNDMSLRWGGRFEASELHRADFTYRPAHQEHRLGEIIDANTKTLFDRQGLGPAARRDPKFEQACQTVGLATYAEGDHYHLRVRRRGGP